MYINLNIIHPLLEFISSEIITNVIIYIVYVFIHNISSNAYTYYCTPLTLRGLLLSPIIIISPHCKTILWVINHTSYNIEFMWILLGTFIIKKIISTFSIVKTHTNI